MDKRLLSSTADKSSTLGGLKKVLAEKLNSKLRVFRCIEKNYFSYGAFEYLALWIHNRDCCFIQR